MPKMAHGVGARTPVVQPMLNFFKKISSTTKLLPEKLFKFDSSSYRFNRLNLESSLNVFGNGFTMNFGSDHDRLINNLNQKIAKLSLTKAHAWDRHGSHLGTDGVVKRILAGQKAATAFQDDGRMREATNRADDIYQEKHGATGSAVIHFNLGQLAGGGIVKKGEEYYFVYVYDVTAVYEKGALKTLYPDSKGKSTAFVKISPEMLQKLGLVPISFGGNLPKPLE